MNHSNFIQLLFSQFLFRRKTRPFPSDRRIRKHIALFIAPAAFAVFLGTNGYADEGDSPSFAYLLHCAGCHLEDGSGDPPEIPDLRQELGLLLAVPEGRKYALSVPGVADTPVSADQMAALMTWMVSMLYPDHEGFEPFTAAEVASGRVNRLQDPAQIRKQLLLELGSETPEHK